MNQVAACRLDGPALDAQLDRYRRLARHATQATRADRRLTVDFTPELDAALLDQTLAVERGCCPYFGIEYDARRRRLTMTVDSSDREAALDAVYQALSSLDR